MAEEIDTNSEPTIEVEDEDQEKDPSLFIASL